jgi:hypothetical protein
MSVDPRAPVKYGTRRGIFSLAPTEVVMFTAGNVARSESALVPIAPTQVPWILKWEKSTG